MLIYDDTAAPAIQAAAEEARRLGAAGYDTRHLLLGLLGTGEPLTRRVTEAAPHLTADAVHAALTADEASAAAGTGSRRDRPSAPAREFRRTMSDFTAKWGPLIKARQLPRRPKFSSAELWLMVLERSALSSQLLQSLGEDPQELRDLVLATMVADSQPVPDWPDEVPMGRYERFIARLIGRGHTRRS